MKDDIREYEHREPSVLEVGDHFVRAFLDEGTPAIGSTLWVGNTPTRVRSLIGSRRVDAIAFDTSAISVGDSVRLENQLAAWPTPREGSTDVTDLSFEPGRERRAAETDGEVSPVTTGIETLDTVLPFARGGVNVILDAGAPNDLIDQLVERIVDGDVVAASARRPGFDVTHHVAWTGGESMPLALQVAANWAYELGDVTLYAESGPIDLDEWTSDLGSTVICRVVLDEGLEIIAETLDIGTSDCQLFVRSDGTIDFQRSHSRLADDEGLSSNLARYAELVDKVAIFGTEEIDEDDLELYERIQRLERTLLNL